MIKNAGVLRDSTDIKKQNTKRLGDPAIPVFNQIKTCYHLVQVKFYKKR